MLRTFLEDSFEFFTTAISTVAFAFPFETVSDSELELVLDSLVLLALTFLA